MDQVLKRLAAPTQEAKNAQGSPSSGPAPSSISSLPRTLSPGCCSQTQLLPTPAPMFGGNPGLELPTAQCFSELLCCRNINPMSPHKGRHSRWSETTVQNSKQWPKSNDPREGGHHSWSKWLRLRIQRLGNLKSLQTPTLRLCSSFKHSPFNPQTPTKAPLSVRYLASALLPAKQPLLPCKTAQERTA